MPALPSVPAVLRVDLVGTDDSDTNLGTRFHVQYDGDPPSNAQCVTYAGSILTAYGANLASKAPTTFTMNTCRVVDLTSDTAGAGESVASIAGTQGGNPLPIGVCFVMAYTISRRYRGGKPRGFWRFGSSTTQADDRTWTSGEVTNVEEAMNAFADAVLAAGWTGAGTLTWVNVSYYSGFTSVQNPVTLRWRNIPTLRTDPVVDPLVEFVGQQVMGSQRRRYRAA